MQARLRLENFHWPEWLPSSTVHDLQQQQHPMEHWIHLIVDFQLPFLIHLNFLVGQVMKHSDFCEKEEITNNMRYVN